MKRHPERVIASGSELVYLCVFEKGDIIGSQSYRGADTSVAQPSFNQSNPVSNSLFNKGQLADKGANAYPTGIQNPVYTPDQYGMTKGSYGQNNYF